MTRVLSPWVPAVLIGLVLTGSCSSDDDPRFSEAPPELGLSFDGSPLVSDDNDGAEAVEVASLHSPGGAIEATESSDGSTAARFPGFAEEGPALAVVTVRPVGEDDFLAPGTDGFAFGADFSLDAESEGGADDGNNLMQRGLFGSGSQYKLQIDRRTVSCRVKGADGELVVEAADPVIPGTWYRARCVLRDGGLTLRLGELDGGEPGEWETATAQGTPGEVSFADDVPLSIGGKLSPEGELVPSSPDQFNGAMDNVYYARSD